jgi:ATP-dependent protease ClpP protease subunit
MTMRPAVSHDLATQIKALLARRDARPLPQGHVRPAVQLTAQADGDGAELLIYDEISWWGICATDVAAVLSTVSGPLHVRVNSPGGDVFDGIAIYNMLADYDGEVTVTVDGLAASAASFIAMAGDTIRMNRASQMMIHDASGMCWGNAADMKAMAALLDMVSGTLAGIYAARTGVDTATWRSRMLEETWYTAESAVEAGLADEMVPHPTREDDGDDEEQPDLAAVFPYGAPDERGRWRLAALIPLPTPPTTDQAPAPGVVPRPPVDQTLEPVPAPPADDTDADRADVEQLTDPTEDEAESAPVETQPAPAAEPDPAPVEEPDTAADDDPVGGEWTDLVAHLTEPEPTEVDLLTRLREAK